MGDDNLFDELSDEFVAEIRDLLDAAEPDFLAMEQSGDDVDPELINRAFRAIHSIKGSAGFAGFEALKVLSHAVENVLVKIRDGEMLLNSDKMDAMLAGMDKIRTMVDDIHANNDIPHADEMERLNEIILKSDSEESKGHAPVLPQASDSEESKGHAPVLPHETSEGQDIPDTLVESAIQPAGSDDTRVRLKAVTGIGEYLFDVEREKVASAVSDAMYLFALWVYEEDDLKAKGRTQEEFIASLEEAGRVLLSLTPTDDGICRFLLGSILESVFLVKMVDIPEEQVCRFEHAAILDLLKESNIQPPSASPALPDEEDETIRLNAVFPDEGEHIFMVETDKVAATVSGAMYLLALVVHAGKDLKAKERTLKDFMAGLEESGLLLDTHSDSEPDGLCHFLFGTILEPEFVTRLFDIPQEQICRFERTPLLETLAEKGRSPSPPAQKEDEDEKPHLADESQQTEDSTASSDQPPSLEESAHEPLDKKSAPEAEPPLPEQRPVSEEGVPMQKPVSEKDEQPFPDQKPVHEESVSDTGQVTPADSDRKSDFDPTALAKVIAEKKSPADNRQHPTPHKQRTPDNGHFKKKSAPETIRANVELVDKLMNLVGEMVLGRNQLHRSIQKFIDDNPHINPLMQNLNVVISEVQENIMQMRMQPVANVLNKFPRIVRDVSRQLSKEVDLTLEGETVELDKSILEGLSNPLTHLVRNCVDHGIERPEERIGKGKPKRGRIRLRVFHDGGQVNITIKDDGKGIDAERVAEQALVRGFADPGRIRRMSENEKLSLIFLPGLSTAEKVTDISGRGVGMDVVKTNISKLGGHINIESAVGEGTTVHIIIPLTLAIIPSLIVGAGGFRFAIPQINVQELVCVRANDPLHRIEKVGESDVLRLRGRLLPLVSLSSILNIPTTFIHPETGEELPERRKNLADRQKKRPRERRQESKTFFREMNIVSDDSKGNVRDDRRQSPCYDICIVVLKVGMNAFGLHVDDLSDNEEIVVKPLSDHLKDCKCFAGATIMGDGRVAMILDAAGISSYARLHFGEIEAEERRRKKKAAGQMHSLRARQPIIIFNNALDEYFALPLAGVSRLELIDSQVIERVGEQEFLTYHEDALPLLRLERLLPISPLPEELTELYVIIPKTTYSPVGIIVSRILDTIDTDVSFMSLKRDMTTAQGFWGSAMFDGHLTFFLNTEELIELFEKDVQEPEMTEEDLMVTMAEG